MEVPHDNPARHPQHPVARMQLGLRVSRQGAPGNVEHNVGQGRHDRWVSGLLAEVASHHGLQCLTQLAERDLITVHCSDGKRLKRVLSHIRRHR